MTEISRTALFGKLNRIGYKAIESATVFCKMRGNPYVELVHWLHQILQLPDSDLHRIIRGFEIDPSKLARDFTDALDRLPRGSRSISDLSADVEEAMEQGWLYGSLMFGALQVRTGHLMVGIVKTRALRRALVGISAEFDKIGTDALTEDLAKLIAGSPEDGETASEPQATPGEASGALAPAAMGKQEALKQFSVDLTERARDGKLDPIVGRDPEIRRVVDILMRRRQNNPILTGEAGVGKTAVVEGFAQRIADGDVPPALADVTLRVLDIGLLQAGASMKGEFENRLRQVIEEVQSAAKPIILFIDEAHTLIGAGGSAGTGDAANLLKPALARGTLRTIAATTWAEYKRYFEKDPALTRRFQVIQIGEPDEADALLMVRGLAAKLEDHHKVLLLDEALEAAVRLSHRYIPARQLPDKAISLLDTACARVAISQSGLPAEVEDARDRVSALDTELGIIVRETAVGVDTDERERTTRTEHEQARAELDGLMARWKQEKGLVERILELRAKLRADAGTVDGDADPPDADASVQQTEQPESSGTGPTEPAGQGTLTDAERQALVDELRDLQAQLTERQGEHPLILPSVDAQAIATVVADWTGIPVGRMLKNEITAVLDLADTLEHRVVGQRPALKTIARRIQTARAGLDNPAKPIGVFLLAGPSGVGKTESALALAEALYGGEQNIITINMSEFQEAHTVSTLKGSPPGYVGYGEGGILTEAVRRRPYSVVLLDEIEKAHPDVHELFFQVFDKGWMEDAEGRYIDFHNTVILLTTNTGSDLIMDMCKDPELLPEPDGLTKALHEPLRKVFPAALLGRLVVVPYYPLGDAMLAAIIRLQLGRIGDRIQLQQGVPFRYDDAVVALIAKRCAEVESGARVVDSILTNTLLPAISREVLHRTLDGRAFDRVEVGVTDDDLVYRFDAANTSGNNGQGSGGDG